MAGEFCPPKELDFTGNLSQNWNKWKKEFKLYLTASESHEKSDAVKTSRLLTAIGNNARDIYYTFTFNAEGDNTKLNKVIEKFDKYMSPKKILHTCDSGSFHAIKWMDNLSTNTLPN